MQRESTQTWVDSNTADCGLCVPRTINFIWAGVLSENRPSPRSCWKKVKGNVEYGVILPREDSS